eukprot:TRINITY_DN3209_c0_g1_i1.p1 TRINITY_DN3209_c0_g1~~TRINITY_DN3209_c0_g1_i1.p1  ORF type:complete len:227 (+),score=53.69 TRINITY_DN3209_c0_g1_i1:76-756(+)
MTNLQKQVDDFKLQIANDANIIVQERMPAKILDLTALLKDTPNFNLSFSKNPQNSADDQSKSKKRKLDNTDTPELTSESSPSSNKVIIEVLTIVKKELLELIEMVNTVKIWVQLNIPQIEDGNNFGVGVQEEIVNELGRAEQDTFAILESMTKYFITRAKLFSKVKKYPEIEDYLHSVKELDDKEYVNLRLCALDLRNSYAILHDMITKNLDKIKKPRNSNHLALF